MCEEISTDTPIQQSRCSLQQTQHYVKIYNETYINKILKHHSWLEKEKLEGMQKQTVFLVPMHAETTYQRKLKTI